ncbi:tRNA (N(6)-L-threonylcarbamoyladenosine(37)-C(2))-methylthiotransferase MtaB [candidate division TA06 bacterium]|uniref:tRNA (N(6)-L-threonylcarbamoyladenosine(37)-C(2))-methylthiotransferase MtaB n=1 Tax=candidate division TA06 bacterium TaxID=2250710 RepID=A0A523USS1_UNCT6|nr:MAG: tRNA (N(6)-L-threonylcarbamoyladenosine(37)-C(2))-methylthiotransferase MtaB [candidate division TA06 bacterium]
MKRVSFQTLGCKLNQYDTQVLIEAFSRSPLYEVVEPGADADIRVINTCTVTSKTDRQSRNLIRRAAKMSPKPMVVVTGCFAQVNPDAIMAIPGVDRLVPNSDRSVEFKRLFGVETSECIHSFCNHTRAFVKIQEGCDNYCSYCIVSFARGKSRARPAQSVVREVRVLADGGYKEVVVTGTDVGRYQDDSGNDLLALLKQLQKIESLKRIRLSSIHPDEVSERLVEFYAGSSKMCPHVHLSIQSADDGILRTMNRNYTRRDCEIAVERLVRSCPVVAIGADLIAGFPGESSQAFSNTLGFVRDLPLAYLHVFPFSARSGTEAASMSDQVRPEVRKERAATLRQLGREKWVEYRRGFLGKELDCLVESRRKEGKLIGLSGNYIHIQFYGDDELKNAFVPVELTEVDESCSYGEVCQG